MRADRPLILVTNDDGIRAPGLRALRQELSALGRVVVVAPERQQSASSHAITLHHPLRVLELEPDVMAVQGTPTDCVMMAVRRLLERRPDVVVSGVNDGPNLGDDVNYSGTVAAAMEGSLLGVPSLAVSLAGGDGRSFAVAAGVAARVTRMVMARQAPRAPEDALRPASSDPVATHHRSPGRREERMILNVNVPGLPADRLRGLRVVRLGKRFYHDAVIERVDPYGGRYYWIGGESPTWVPEAREAGMTDCVAVEEGFVSVTPLQLDLTDFESLHEIAGWDWQDDGAPATGAGRTADRTAGR